LRRAIAACYGLGMTAFEAFNEGVALSLKGEHARAVAAFDRAILLDANHHVAIASKAFSLAQLGRSIEAIDSFKQAIRLNPDDAMSFFQLGLTYLEVGDTQRAEIAVRGAAEIDPAPDFHRESAAELCSIGDYLMKTATDGLEHYRQALTAFTLASELDPHLAEARKGVHTVQALLQPRH
jgi:tetratricopeptide (TPR) repeat protein